MVWLSKVSLLPTSPTRADSDPSSSPTRLSIRESPARHHTERVITTPLAPRTRAERNAGLDPRIATYCSSPKVRISIPSTIGRRDATPAVLLCRDCGSRRCACCRPDPRQPASAPGPRCRGRAATLVNADPAPGPDEQRAPPPAPALPVAHEDARASPADGRRDATLGARGAEDRRIDGGRRRRDTRMQSCGPLGPRDRKRGCSRP